MPKVLLWPCGHTDLSNEIIVFVFSTVIVYEMHYLLSCYPCSREIEIVSRNSPAVLHLLPTYTVVCVKYFCLRFQYCHVLKKMMGLIEAKAAIYKKQPCLYTSSPPPSQLFDVTILFIDFTSPNSLNINCFDPDNNFNIAYHAISVHFDHTKKCWHIYFSLRQIYNCSYLTRLQNSRKSSFGSQIDSCCNHGLR